MSFALTSSKNRFVAWLPSIVSFSVLLLSFWALRHLLHDFHPREVIASLMTLPKGSVVLAVILIIGSYLINTVYDAIGCRWIGKPVPYRHLGFASFIGYAFGNTIGMPLLSGGSVRYRVYSSWGLTAAEVTAVVCFCMWTFVLGCVFTFGMTLLLSPVVFLPLPLSTLGIHLLGVFFLLLLGAYIVFTIYGPKKITIFGRRIPVPSWEMTVQQAGLSSLTILFEATAVYLLIPPALGIPLASVVAAFVFASAIGHFSQVPGGIGVMETGMLLMIGNEISRPALLGVFLIFRVIYNLLPLIVAIALLGIYELSHEKGWFRSAMREMPVLSEQLVPQLIVLTTSAAGALLVLGGSLPPPPLTTGFLHDLTPFGLEAAHLVASLAGLQLLLLAPKLECGRRKTFRAVMITLIVGIIAGFLRSMAVVQIVILLVVLASILISEPVIRRTDIKDSPEETPEWLLTVATTVCGAIFLTSLAFPTALSTPGTWLQFGLTAAAGRAVRTTAIVSVLAVIAIVRTIHRGRRC